MPRPNTGDFAPYYQSYIEKATGSDVVAILDESYKPLQGWLTSLDETKLGYRYAPGKWTLAQVLQHIIDAERVFAYRAMCIARGEQQALPGFDENGYADAAPASGRKLKGLTDELLNLRKATTILFRSIAGENALEKKGTASNKPITVNALGFIIAGHVLHHQAIVDTLYLSK